MSAFGSPADRERPVGGRAGFTLIEILVAITIIGVLLSLTIPAVMGARESARRIQCVNNLKQIGLGLLNYESVYSHFPSLYSDSVMGVGPNMSGAAHGYSPFARMLAQLDQGNLFNNQNLTLSHTEVLAILANQTVATTTVALFLCPSDRGSSVPGYGRVTYRFNTGPTARITTYPPPLERPERVSAGAFSMSAFYTTAEFPDGLSNTIGASERLQGDWISDRFSRDGDYRLADYGLDKADDPDDGIDKMNRCHARAETLPAESRGGESWFFSGFHFSAYNHCQPPNPATDDCSFDNFIDTIHDRTCHSGTFPARSRHRGGVNVLYMDGRVGNVSNSIDPGVWMALSTRNGGEAITSEFQP